MKRRSFIVRSSLAVGYLSTNSGFMSTNQSRPKISLAQWSHHRAFREGQLNPDDFASIARSRYAIEAVEYVAGFYEGKASDMSFWKEMKSKSDDNEVANLLIMIDEHGDLGDSNEKARIEAVEKHRPWLDAASQLDCHSIRVNAFGDGDEATLRSSLIDGMGRLCEYAANQNINVLIENHGLYSSNADFIVDVIKQVDMSNFGTLPDFGNWCTSAKWGSIHDGSCEVQYDLYEGVSKYMPYAKSVSAKSYNFDDEGNDRLIDYTRMLEVVKAAGYDGYIGIEYEGTELGEEEGIRKTKELIEKAWG